MRARRAVSRWYMVLEAVLRDDVLRDSGELSNCGHGQDLPVHAKTLGSGIDTTDRAYYTVDGQTKTAREVTGDVGSCRRPDAQPPIPSTSA